MAINKERIRQKLANLKNRGGSNDFWTPPKDGKAIIRLFPCPHTEDPFLEYFYHFNLTKQSIFCPKKNGYAANCAICDLTAGLYNSSDPKDRELSKKIFARQRFYGTMVDRADETATPKYWGFSQTLYMKFLGWLDEDGGDYENFIDVHEGVDLVVTIEAVPGKKFASANVEPRRKESPLAASQKEIDSILKSVRPVTEVFTPLSEAEIKEKLEEYHQSLSSSDQEAVGEEETEVVKGKQDSAPAFTVGTAQDVDRLFEENFPD
jgi:hypothetical protein